MYPLTKFQSEIYLSLPGEPHFPGSIGTEDLNSISGLRLQLTGDPLPYSLRFWYPTPEPDNSEPDYFAGVTYTPVVFAVMQSANVSIEDLVNAVEESFQPKSIQEMEEYNIETTYQNASFVGSLAVAQTSSTPEVFLHFVKFEIFTQWVPTV